MATFSKRTKKDGSIVHDARITLKDKGKVYHRESKTFNSKKVATAWAKRREKELHEEFAHKGFIVDKKTFREVAISYLKYLESQDKLKRTKRTTIELLLKYPIADMDIASINSKDILAHLKHRISVDGAKPQTVNNDKAYIGSVLKHAAVMLDIPTQLNEYNIAVEAAKEHDLVARPDRRERRLSKVEEIALLDHFSDPKRLWMYDIVQFAIASGRRQAEITRIRWEDLDEENLTIKVRDLKHPTARGYTKTSKLTRKAFEIIQRQERKGEFIFDRNPKTIGANFTRACHKLDIKDLRFHDLRHEATSRLFEAGYSIIEVQHFTLHDSWQTLKRYTHLKPENIELRE